jgi:hypothetical protein
MTAIKMPAIPGETIKDKLGFMVGCARVRLGLEPSSGLFPGTPRRNADDAVDGFFEIYYARFPNDNVNGREIVVADHVQTLIDEFEADGDSGDSDQHGAVVRARARARLESAS